MRFFAETRKKQMKVSTLQHLLEKELKRALPVPEAYLEIVLRKWQMESAAHLHLLRSGPMNLQDSPFTSNILIALNRRVPQKCCE
jgi:hypothetical protein